MNKGLLLVRLYKQQFENTEFMVYHRSNKLNNRTRYLLIKNKPEYKMVLKFKLGKSLDYLADFIVDDDGHIYKDRSGKAGTLLASDKLAESLFGGKNEVTV